MTETKKDVLNSLKLLIDEARTNNLWIYSNYQDLWFTPDDLEKANSEGKFLWGVINWRLRDPHERLAELDRQIERLIRERNVLCFVIC